MSEIPLVRARYAYSFAATLNELGVPVGSYLNKHKLSPGLLENQGGLITAHQLWAFAGHAAVREGLPQLGMLAGQVPVVEHGEFGKKVYQGVSLYDAIHAFCKNAIKEYSRADFYLKCDESMAWFCRGPIEGTPVQVQQVELYVLIMMIDTIRLGAGSDWQPKQLLLQNHDGRGLGDIPLFRNADTRFSSNYTAVGFNRYFLAAPLSGEISAFSRPENGWETIAESPDFAKSLRDVLSHYFDHVELTLDNAAEIVGTSRRSLQRRLALSGVSFREVMDQTRFEKARSLLRNESLSLTDIALDMGYADLAHFTRAFRRWAGVPPSAYRKSEIR